LKAVVFDAFGTLVHIEKRRSPFRSLMRWARKHGRDPQPDDAARIMSGPIDLRAAACLLGLEPPGELLAQWDADLETELASVQLYPDSLEAIQRLQQAGYQVALCSNLAQPYGPPVKALLPMLDACAMSYDVGAIKPQPRIYQYLVDQLGCAAGEVLFIGDTPAADVDGPSAFGMQGRLLNRSAGLKLADVLHSLASYGHGSWGIGPDNAGLDTPSR